MRYWLICLPREDLEHCIKNGVFGLSRKNSLGNVREGDKIACCAGKGDWKVIGFGSATSDYYVGDEKVFLKEGFFPDRFDFKAEKLRSNQEIDLMSVIDQLSFVTNVGYWAVFFRNGIAQMSKEDWQLLTDRSKVPVR